MERIGIALSGGGIRAAVFHLGVFKCLAERGLLERVAHISSVSGASLCVGLILCHSERDGDGKLKWPSSADFLGTALPEIERTILKHSVQAAALARLPALPKYWTNRVSLIAKMMEKKWGIRGSLSELPEYPVWEINCTTFETGKNFRFSKHEMGDYLTGAVRDPVFPLADAMASSAGFPILIGPYRMESARYDWIREKLDTQDGRAAKYYYLWDGGVYDNLGLEALYKCGRGLDKTIDFLIVSNASSSSGIRRYRRGLTSAANLKRLLDISMDQVSALRSRDVFANVIQKKKGLYIHIGNAAEKIVSESKIDPEKGAALIAECQSAEVAMAARTYPTTLGKPSKANFDLLLRHGYENTLCNFECFE